MRLNCRDESRRRRVVCTEYATSSRRLPTDLVEKLKAEHVENLSSRVNGCAELETWLRLYTLPDTTQLNMFGFQFSC